MTAAASWKERRPEEIAALEEEAVQRFAREHPELRLAPVAIVIPALNEEASLGGVLAAISPRSCELDVETIVVDDGSSDATGEVARSGGAHVARLERNCGQGTAFKVAYRLAREHGARFIVTLDADGQWDPADVERVLEPVAAGQAELCLGSRVLGRAESTVFIRRIGVWLFATVVRVLTGTRVTDTSTGLRAMTADVTAAVRLVEPQYQASELLVGALVHGYRVVERPVVMHARVAGESVKGRNLFYGLRYARVLARTWWRERRAVRERRVAPALAADGVADETA